MKSQLWKQATGSSCCCCLRQMLCWVRNIYFGDNGEFLVLLEPEQSVIHQFARINNTTDASYEFCVVFVD